MNFLYLKNDCHKQVMVTVPRLFLVALLTVFHVASGAAHAQFRYNYVQADYVFGEFDFSDADVSFAGYQLTLQFEVSSSFVLGVKYLSLNGDDTESTPTGLNTLKYDADGIDAYFFYYTPMSLQTDFFLGGRLDMKEIEARVHGEAPVSQTDDDTRNLFVGLRHQLQGLELKGEWSYDLDAENDEDRWSYTLGLVSGAPGQLQLGFSISPDKSGDIMSVFVRQSY